MGLDVKNLEVVLFYCFFCSLTLIHVDGIVDDVIIASESIAVRQQGIQFNDDINPIFKYPAQRGVGGL